MFLVLYSFCFFFFFFKQKTAYEMRISDWSSDVCSSDLLHDAGTLLLDEPFAAVDRYTTEDLLTLLHEWHGEGRTVVAVLTDLVTVRAYFQQTLLMGGKAGAWVDTDKMLTTEKLRLAGISWAGDSFSWS